MLEVRDLRVRYGPIEAVRGVTLRVEHGEIVALGDEDLAEVGPGAGTLTDTQLLERFVRRRDEAGVTEHDYYLSNAPPESLPGVLARVARAGHRVEECLQRGKGEPDEDGQDDDGHAVGADGGDQLHGLEMHE